MPLSHGVGVLLILSLAAPLALAQTVTYTTAIDGSKNMPGLPTGVQGSCIVQQDAVTGASIALVTLNDIRLLNEVHIHSGTANSADLGANLVTIVQLRGCLYNPPTLCPNPVPYSSPVLSFNALNGYPGTIGQNAAIGMILNVQTPNPSGASAPSSLVQILGNPTVPVAGAVPKPPSQGLYCDVHTYNGSVGANGVLTRGDSAARGQFAYFQQG